jgi:hypothetical protein
LTEGKLARVVERLRRREDWEIGKTHFHALVAIEGDWVFRRVGNRWDIGIWKMRVVVQTDVF